MGFHPGYQDSIGDHLSRLRQEIEALEGLVETYRHQRDFYKEKYYEAIGRIPLSESLGIDPDSVTGEIVQS